MTLTYEIITARGVKALLFARHEIAAERGHSTEAATTIIDLHSAIESAGLTDRQAEAIAWVYGVGTDQTTAASVMGVTQEAISQFTEGAARKIATVFIRWNAKEGVTI